VCLTARDGVCVGSGVCAEDGVCVGVGVCAEGGVCAGIGVCADGGADTAVGAASTTAIHGFLSPGADESAWSTPPSATPG